MKKITRAISLGLGCVAMLGICSACGTQDAPVGKLLGYNTYEYFNTTATWAFVPQKDDDTFAEEELWSQIKGVMGTIEQSISTDIATSSLARFNSAAAGEIVEIDATAYRLMGEAQRLYEKTDGAYNPAVGLLVDLWGFTPRFNEGTFEMEQPYDRPKSSQLPDEQYITAFSSKEMTDFSAITLSESEGKYYALKPQTASVTLPDGEGVEHTYTMQLNFGGIGKGYCVDLAADLIKENGYEYGYFNLGGSSMSVLQDNKGKINEKTGLRPWEIGVNNPRYLEAFKNPSYATVTQANINLSSSGDYEQYYTVEGVRYCHIVNPKTGYPINAEPTNTAHSGIVTASVFGLSAAEGDATTTALTVMGKDGALAYIAEHLAEKDVAFVYYDGVTQEYTIYTNMDETEFRADVNMKVERI